MRLIPLLLLLCAPLAAQPAAPTAESYTLTAYVQAALEKSPEVRQARESSQAAAYQWKSQFAAATLPTLGFTLQGPFYGHSTLNDYRFNVWRMERQDMSAATSLNLNLFNSFQDYLKTRQSRLSRDSSLESLRSVTQSRSFEALRAFYDLDLKLSLQDVTDQNLAAQAEQYRLTEELYRNGMKSLSDLLKSETDWRSAEQRLAAAVADTKSSLVTFNILIERDPFSPAALKADLDPGATVLPQVALDLARALAQKPDVLKARRDLERAQAGLDLALQGMTPTLAVNATLSRADLGPGRPANPNPYYQLGLSLSAPFNFNFASQYFNYRASAAEKKRSAAALASAERTVTSDLHSAYIVLERAYKTYHITSQKEVIASRNLAIVNERYKQGSADVITLAQAQLDYLSARVDRAQALHEAFINRALYKLAVGDPLW
ncbi:MAG: TolC family protein [Elusimicrobia bacterium]|nr:TolC family protein [Elusimicrobiota bacterium]